MKISELIKQLNQELKENGDIPVRISCGKLKQWLAETKQDFIVSEPLFIVTENHGKKDGKELMIRDWPY